MLTTLFYVLAVAGLSFAQQNVTASLYVPMDGDSGLAVSIVSVNPSATVYAFGCVATSASSSSSANLGRRQDGSPTISSETATPRATNDSSEDDMDSENSDDSDQDMDEADRESGCRFASAFTLTQGPSTLHYGFALESVTQTVDCKLMGTTQAVCTGTATGEGADSPGIETATLSGTDLPSAAAFPVTAGQEKLQSASSSSSGQSGSSSKTASSSQNTAGGSSTGASQTSGASAAATSGAAMAIQPAVENIFVIGAGAVGAMLIL